MRDVLIGETRQAYATNRIGKQKPHRIHLRILCGFPRCDIYIPKIVSDTRNAILRHRRAVLVISLFAHT